MEPGTTYPLTISDQSAAYYLYYHRSNSSFRIFEVISSGSIQSMATPLGNSKIKDKIKQNKFIFGSDSPYDDLEITPDQTEFCYKCFYLLKLKGKDVKAVVGVSEPRSPVLLYDNGAVREKI